MQNDGRGEGRSQWHTAARGFFPGTAVAATEQTKWKMKNAK